MPPKTRHLAGGNWLSPLPPVASVLGWDSCPVCRQAMTTRRGVALTGEQFCGRHLGQASCALCGMPADASGLAISLCQRCAATSVRTQADVKRKLPSIKQQLAALGIRTVSPVWVQLASPEKLHGIGGNHALGATVSRGTNVVDLLVLQDLPLLKFGTTVAHEVMHSYMTQNGFGQVPSRIAEGLCQLLAYAWIIRQDGILATAERRQIEENPDLIYGDSFRQAREAVRRVGVQRTLATVKQQHRLP
jgi:Protein DA1